VIDVFDFRTIESSFRRPVSAMADETWQVIPERDRGTQGQAPTTHLLACFQDDQTEEVRAYADYLSGLLQGQISFLEVPAEGGFQRIRKEAGDCDLIVFGEPKQSLIKLLLSGQHCHEAVNQVPVSVLVTRQPRWPIQTILLIVRVEETDEAAVGWVGRLARPSGAKVSVLPVLSSFPSVYAPASSEETALGELLSPNTQPGQHLRGLSQRLAQWQIEGTLRFRQGQPEWQIRWEVTEGNYDLIVIGAEPDDRWQRWLEGELVAPILRWVNRPLLVARPTRAPNSTVGDDKID